MRRVYLIHARGAHPNSYWYPWVRTNLEKLDFDVQTPHLPGIRRPKQAEWLPRLGKLISRVDLDTYFIGHGVGCQAALRFLNTMPKNVRCGGVVLVAGWVCTPSYDIGSRDQIAVYKDWLVPSLDLSTVARRSHRFTAIFSNNDTHVPRDNWTACRKKLKATVVIKSDAGHFASPSQLRLPEVVNAITAMAM